MLWVSILTCSGEDPLTSTQEPVLEWEVTVSFKPQPAGSRLVAMCSSRVSPVGAEETCSWVPCLGQHPCPCTALSQE